MPRQIRVQYPGAIYPVMSRRDRCEDIYLDDVDRQQLLAALAWPRSTKTFILLVWLCACFWLYRALFFSLGWHG
jgi:hypothetical protein